MPDGPTQAPVAIAAVEQVLSSLFKEVGLWRDSESVGRALKPMADDPKAVGSKARLNEQVFAAWDGTNFRYPSFQFDSDGEPLPMTAQLIAVLPRDANGKVGHDAVLWVFSPDAALDGETPATVFPREPSRVVSLASLRRSGGLQS